MQLFLLLILIFTTFYIGISWFLSTKILSPESSLALSQAMIQTDWGTAYEEIASHLQKPTDFSVNSFDGVTLKGKYFTREEPAQCVVIAAHGWTGTWIEMLKYIPALADCPCDLVIYDQRAHGLSSKSYPTGGINESKDLLAITEWVQKEKRFEHHEIGWLGSSWGAAAALLAGTTEKKASFIIADAPFQDWYSAIFERGERDYGFLTKLASIGIMRFINLRTGVNYREASPLQAVKKIKIPVLLIHSKMDCATDSQQSVNISQNLNSKSEFHHLTWGGGHTLDVVLHKEKFKTIVNNFLRKVNGKFLIEKSE